MGISYLNHQPGICRESMSSTVPPVVIPASGNNIVISPLQVHAYSCRKEFLSHASFIEGQSSSGVH